MFRPARHFPTPGASVVDEFVIGDHVGDRIGPAGVDALIERTAEADGRSVEIAFWRDPGQAGKAQAHALVAKLGLLGYAVHTIPASRDKEAYARVWSPLVEKGSSRSWTRRGRSHSCSACKRSPAAATGTTSTPTRSASRCSPVRRRRDPSA